MPQHEHKAARVKATLILSHSEHTANRVLMTAASRVATKSAGGSEKEQNNEVLRRKFPQKPEVQSYLMLSQTAVEFFGGWWWGESILNRNTPNK